MSHKTSKKIKNFAIHCLLAVLAFIWVFPILWVILTSFRAEKGSYVSTFLPQAYTLDNYIDPELPADVHEHTDHRDLFLYPVGVLCTVRLLLSVQTEI